MYGPKTTSQITLGTQRIVNGTQAPIAGTWAVGDLVLNTAATAGGILGWICVAAGTPGTWKEVGLISL